LKQSYKIFINPVSKKILLPHQLWNLLLKHYLTKFMTPPVSIHTPNTQQKPTYNNRYILFHNKRQQKEMGVPEIDRFLASLAVEGNAPAHNTIAAKHLMGCQGEGGAIGLSPKLAPTDHLQCSEVGIGT
jgi:hypothetical protein